MLNKEKCMSLIKTAQFEELFTMLEQEYKEIFDKIIVKLDPTYASKLSSMTLSEEARVITIKKPDAEGIILIIMQTFLEEDEDTMERISSLIDLYKPVCNILESI